MDAPGGYVTPGVGKAAFNCPLCGAYGGHSWSSVWLGPPSVISAAQVAEREKRKRQLQGAFSVTSTPQTPPRPADPVDPNMLGFEDYKQTPGQSLIISGHVKDAVVSQCPVCLRRLVWVNGRIVWPQVGGTQPANPDMPKDVLEDYQEAASIVYQSPRGAAALLRLAVQKLCKHLGEPGKNINTDVGALVTKGLDTHIQEALDAVRVIGNEAVHPGEMDLKDDDETAVALFGLVNLIVEDMISRKKRIKAVYSKLPPSKLKGIESRDEKTKSTPPIT